MSEESVKPVAPVVNPVKDKIGNGDIDLKTADLTALKAAFDAAVKERTAIDTRINDLRRAIKGRLKEFQALNDTVSNIDSTSSRSILTIPAINWSKVWSFVWGWVIPAVILFVLLWYGVRSYKARHTIPSEDWRIPIEQSIIPGHNVMDRVFTNQEGELWS